MDVTTWKNRRWIGKAAWIAAWAALVLGQLHALSRFATEDGKEDLKLPLTRLWAEPAADLLHPLLGWANPDVVYLTYGKIWGPLFALTTLCAFMIYRLRRPVGFERWAWRVALFGYTWAAAGIFVDYWTQWTGTTAIMDVALLIALPGLLIGLVASTVLGCSLLRRRYPSKVAAVMLAVTFPYALLITQVTSMGSMILLVMFATGIVGRRLAGDPSYVERLAVAHPDSSAVATPATSDLR